MQYPKIESTDNSIQLNLMKAAFQSAHEILILVQANGVVLETNAMADRYCGGEHILNVGANLWDEKMWSSDWDRKKCQRAFQIALQGKPTEFFAGVGADHGGAVSFRFSVQKVTCELTSENYYLLAGSREAL